MSDLLKQYGAIKISSNRHLYEVRYPMFCILQGKTYDTNKPVSFVQVLDYLRHGNDLRTVIVLDSFDLALYGYIDSDDLADFEISDFVE